MTILGLQALQLAIAGALYTVSEVELQTFDRKPLCFVLLEGCILIGHQPQ